MKHASVISATVLSLLFGAAGVACAQHEEQGKSRNGSNAGAQTQHTQPVQQAQHAQHTPPQQIANPSQSHARTQPSYGGAYHGGVQANGPTFGGVHRSGVPQQAVQVRSGFGQSRAGSWKGEHQSWTQRGGYNGYRIPDARFRLYFGRDHFFRIYGLPLVFVGGQPRFQYDGYWVTIIDPWPESWGPDWYETDDVYLDNTGDGYYLYDRNYPDYPIAVTVSF